MTVVNEFIHGHGRDNDFGNRCYTAQERELTDIKKLAGRGSKVMLTKSMLEVAELSLRIFLL